MTENYFEALRDDGFNFSIILSTETAVGLAEAAEWCDQSISNFVETAIRDRLAEVQAAMEEEVQ